MNYTLVIVTALAIGGSCILVAGRAGVKWGFLFWICTLGLGYRTMVVTPNFRLHPSVIALCVCFLWLILTTSKTSPTKWWIPLWVWAMVPFWYWGWIVGAQSEFDWDAMLSELQNFVIFIPLFAVAATVLQDKREWKTVILVFFATATFVGALGLIEYYYPGIRGIFPNFVSNTDPNIGNDGFERAPFSFWGHPAASFLCAMAIPFMLPIMKLWRPGQAGQIVLWLSFGLLPWATYRAGYRALWLYLLLQLLFWLLLQRHYGLGILVTAASLGGYASLPEATKLRIESFILALQGNPVESSGADHLGRLSDAVASVFDVPWGRGWTGAGWVHNDFLQVADNLGDLAGIIFAAAFLWTAWGLLRATMDRSHPDRPLFVALLLSFLTAGGIMATQVICVLPQLACPVWFIWVLSVIAIRQRNAEKRGTNHGRAHFRVAANVQLREHSAGYAPVGPASV